MFNCSVIFDRNQRFIRSDSEVSSSDSASDALSNSRFKIRKLSNKFFTSTKFVLHLFVCLYNCSQSVSQSNSFWFTFGLIAGIVLKNAQ